MLISALVLAGLSPVHAAPSDTDYVNERPCNDLCKAYMAWSDRLLAASRPHPLRPQTLPPQPQPPQRTAVQPRKPERTLHQKPEQTLRRASGTSHLSFKSFTQLLRRSDAAPRAADMPTDETAAPPAPSTPMAERAFAADERVTAGPAVTGSAINDSPQAIPVSLTAPISGTEAPHADSRGPDLRFALVLVLALSLCTWLAIMLRERFRGRTRTAALFR